MGLLGKTSLITGTTGFVGSVLTRHLYLEGWRARVGLLRDLPGYLGLPNYLNYGVVGSVTDVELIHRTLVSYEVNYLFHIAAQAIVPHALANPFETFESNIRGTYCILEAARRYGNLEGILVASSDKAFGIQENLPYTEKSPLLGIFPYDVSKVCADLLAQSYAKTYNLPVVITRCANIYGPGDRNESRLIPSIILSVMKDTRPQIRSDGTSSRDYVYVEDVVRGMTQLIERAKELKGLAFNLGTGIPTSVLELAGTILRLMDSDLEPEILGTAKGEIDSQYLDASLAKQILGWTPRYSLEEGLKLTIDWWRKELS